MATRGGIPSPSQRLKKPQSLRRRSGRKGHSNSPAPARAGRLKPQLIRRLQTRSPRQPLLPNRPKAWVYNVPATHEVGMGGVRALPWAMAEERVQPVVVEVSNFRRRWLLQTQAQILSRARATSNVGAAKGMAGLDQGHSTATGDNHNNRSSNRPQWAALRSHRMPGGFNQVTGLEDP